MERKTVYALGFFDGVHLGHQALLQACRELAGELDANIGAVTFDTHPEILTAHKAPRLINRVEDRNQLLCNLGVERLCTLPFDQHIRTMPWQDFFRLLLVEYGAAGLVCGDDFRFGYQGEGNALLLQQVCREAGIPCRIVPEQVLDGERISSTRIRKLLENGEMEAAVRLLGHPHMLTGRVVSGRQLGRTIGVPTANLPLPEQLARPKYGVYACNAHVGGHVYPAVTNIGTRPTVEGHHATVEAWLLGFEGDLYGKTMTLEFHKFLRPETKFESLEKLKLQIQADAAQVYKLLR